VPSARAEPVMATATSKVAVGSEKRVKG
jgi:hypothetical protein